MAVSLVNMQEYSAPLGKPKRWDDADASETYTETTRYWRISM